MKNTLPASIKQGRGRKIMDAFDEERPAHAPKDLTAWNIEDLQAYIADMTAEIARCEEIIEEKKRLSSAADGLFKK